MLTTTRNLNDILTLKLTSGEELICRFQSQTESEITVSKPLALMATQQSAGLVPFMHTVPLETHMTFTRSCVILVAKTDAEIAKQYAEQTSSIKMI